MKIDDVISALRATKYSCHWNKILVCTRGLNCDGCESQPADDDKSNGKNEPVHIGWENNFDGTFPYCPSCGEMPYSTERCVFCGQKFIQDEIIAEYNKPPEKVTMNCPMCGGKNTLVGARAKSNGHFHGTCEKCGCVVME